jgi:glutamate 5-kinase
MVSALSVADSRSDLTSISALNENDEVTEFQQIQVGPMDRWSVHVAELIGIFYVKRPNKR